MVFSLSLFLISVFFPISIGAESVFLPLHRLPSNSRERGDFLGCERSFRTFANVPSCFEANWLISRSAKAEVIIKKKGPEANKFHYLPEGFVPKLANLSHECDNALALLNIWTINIIRSES